MLSARLDAQDIGSEWRVAPTGWTAGQSTIQPYRHPALSAELRCSAHRVAVVVRERTRGSQDVSPANRVVSCSDDVLDRWLADAHAWPLDFVSLVLTNNGRGCSAEVRAGQWGTAPVYLHVRSGVLRIDWDVAQLYPHLRSSTLNVQIAATMLLTLGQPYSRRTVFSEITMLTERAAAHWRAPFDAVTVTYPSPLPHAHAGRLRGGADVAGTFREILLASMRRRRAADSDPIAIELSGGLDSSIVASTASLLPSPIVRSYGMIMPGRAGAYQQQRRNEVVSRSNLHDRSFACIEYPPFGPRGLRASAVGVVPWEEFYTEPTAQLLSMARADGLHAIYTGIGGDELCSYQAGEPIQRVSYNSRSNFPEFATAEITAIFRDAAERIDTAPQALTYTSVLESCAAASPLYLRNGIWPISPLSTPELVEFCRRLPWEWRHKRAISRRVLGSFGYSRRLTHPRRAHLENFLDVMDYALRDAASALIESLFAESRLESQGLIDGRRFIESYRVYRKNGGDTHGDRILAALLLELTIRSIENAKSSRTAAAAP